MKSYQLNGKPIGSYFKDFKGGVARIKNGKLEIYAGDHGAAEAVKAAGGGVVPRTPSEPAKLPQPSAKSMVQAPQAAKSGDVALPGAEGKAAEELLKSAQSEGVRTLNELSRVAVKRLLRNQAAINSVQSLFTPEERQTLAASLEAATATADLLGRSRIQLRRQKAEQQRENFSEDEPVAFTAFADTPTLKPLAPIAAISYFKKRVPTLRVNVNAFTQAQREKAFWIAKKTDLTILNRVKKIIFEALTTGKGISEGPRAIDAVLTEAGVSDSNYGYAETVFRTNVMDAYNHGAEEERQTPEAMETFPIWRYLGIDDGREGEDHKPHFDKYFPAAVKFTDIRNQFVVRGGQVVRDTTGKGRPFRCRCLAQAVSKFSWPKLKANGARIADGYIDPTENQAVLHAEKFCQEGANKGKPGPCPGPRSNPPARGRMPVRPPNITPKEYPQESPLPPRASKTLGVLLGHLKGTDLPKDKKAAYGTAMVAVVRAMPEAAHRLIAQNLKSVSFSGNSRELAETIAGDMTPRDRSKYGSYLKAGKGVAGCYLDNNASLHVDGAWGEHNEAHVYAHEFGHALDGPKHTLSSSVQWQQVFKKELANSQLTKYASVKPSEGLAEFSRLLYGGDVDLAKVKKAFPFASRFFELKGLWPNATSYSEAFAEFLGIPEIFDSEKRIDLGTSHADVLLHSEESDQSAAKFSETTDDLVACGVSPPVAGRIPLDAAVKINRFSFQYREAETAAECCRVCKQFAPGAEDQGHCNLFQCLHDRAERYNLLAEANADMVCAAFEPKPLNYAEEGEEFAERSPVGGVTVAGHFYRGGQFIPGSVANTPEGKAEISKAKARVAENKTDIKEEVKAAKGELSEAPAEATVPLTRKDPGIDESLTKVNDFLSQNTEGSHRWPVDPFGYAKFNPEGHEQAAKAVYDFAKEELKKNSFARSRIMDAFKKAREVDPSLSLEDFKGLLTTMALKHEISLHPWTLNWAGVPPENKASLLFLDREARYYLSPGEKEPTVPEKAKAAVEAAPKAPAEMSVQAKKILDELRPRKPAAAAQAEKFMKELQASKFGTKDQPYYRPGANPTVDNIVTRDDPKTGERQVLMIQRKDGTVEGGKWALPGGFHDSAWSLDSLKKAGLKRADVAKLPKNGKPWPAGNLPPKGQPWQPGAETASQAAMRELEEETGVKPGALKKSVREVGKFEGNKRDPRDNAEAWSASTAFAVHLTPEQAKAMDKVKGLDDASDAKWVPVSELAGMGLAFDHGKILEKAGVETAPKPPEPGFTGTDRLGRKWQDGKLVAAKGDLGGEAQPAANESVRQAVRGLSDGTLANVLGVSDYKTLGVIEGELNEYANDPKNADKKWDTWQDVVADFKNEVEHTKGGWLSRIGDKKEAVFDAMRSVREKSDAALEQYRKLSQKGGEIAAGGAHFDEFLKGESLAVYLRGINKGMTPDEALEAAKEESKAMVSKWNAQHKGDYQVQRWTGAGESGLMDAHRQVLAAKEKTAEPRKRETVQGDEKMAALSNMVNEDAARRDWSKLPDSFRADAVKALKAKLQPHFRGNANNEIQARGALAKASTHEEIAEALKKLWGTPETPKPAAEPVDPTSFATNVANAYKLPISKAYVFGKDLEAMVKNVKAGKINAEDAANILAKSTFTSKEMRSRNALASKLKGMLGTHAPEGVTVPPLPPIETPPPQAPTKKPSLADRIAENAQHYAIRFDPDIAATRAKAKVAGTPGLIKGMLENNRGGAPFLSMAVEHGLATNGRWMMKLPAKEHDKIKAAGEGKYDKTAGDRIYKHAQEMMGEAADPQPAAIAGGRVREETARKKIGGKMTDISVPLDPEYVIKSPSGKTAVVNSNYYETIMKRYPNATVHLATKSGDKNPLHFKVGGETVAILMPMDIKEKPKMKGEAEKHSEQPNLFKRKGK